MTSLAELSRRQKGYPASFYLIDPNYNNSFSVEKEGGGRKRQEKKREKKKS